jgi:general secretion pathway protein K
MTLKARAYLRGAQRGVALLTVLVILAIATTMSAAMIWDRGLDQQRTATLVQGDQAMEYALGAEAWAEQILRRDLQNNPGGVTLSQDWAAQLPPLPVEGGQVSGKLEDLQGRFNINNLAGGNAKQYREQFVRLLAALSIDPNAIDMDAIVDWVTAGNTVTQPGGAKDDFYSRLPLPYRTANQPITSISELQLVKGMTPQLYAQILPYVCALPSTSTTVNVNTAPVPVLQSLADNIGADAAAMAVEKRGGTGFKALDQVFPGIVVTNAGFTSNYFLLTATVEIGSTRLTMYSLLYRNGANNFIAIRRTFGAY